MTQYKPRLWLVCRPRNAASFPAHSSQPTHDHDGVQCFRRRFLLGMACFGHPPLRCTARARPQTPHTRQQAQGYKHGVAWGCQTPQPGLLHWGCRAAASFEASASGQSPMHVSLSAFRTFAHSFSSCCCCRGYRTGLHGGCRGLHGCCKDGGG